MLWCWLFMLLFGEAFAKRSLYATSLVTCMENSQLQANSFDVKFNPDDRSLFYNLDMTTSINSYVYALIDVYAYGFKIITKEVDLCNINWKQFCPVHPGNIQIESIQYISEEYVNEIPGIAYHVPDIDAFAKVRIYSPENQYLACVQVFFSNGKTVSQTAIKWVSAVIAGIGLLLSATLSTFGNSRAASHISANTMLLFLYFQSVVVVCMQHVHRVPPIAAAWTENLVWSMGLIRVTFMQKIFRWYVQSTGGTPDLYLTSKTQSVLTQRAIDYIRSSTVYKRAEEVLYGNQNTMIFRGIKRLGYQMKIEPTSIVPTGFTFFVLCGYLLAGVIIAAKYAIELCIRAGWMDKRRFFEFRQNWRLILKGAILRYIYIGFVQLTILSFWEFTQRDSAAVIVIACLFVVLSCGLMLWSIFRTYHYGQKSIRLYNNPAALLYGDEYVLHKYGFFYTMFSAKFYWWNGVLLPYLFLKSLFVGFAQASGKTQALAIFIFDFFYTIAIIRYKPYLDKPTNVMNILICVVTSINSFLFMFFSDLFKQGYQVSAVMGWVFFILNAAFSLILLLMILTFTLLMVFSKNPDLRFKPAKDDRASFQKTGLTNPFEDSPYSGDNMGSPSTFSSESPYNEKKKNRKYTAADELLALGNVAEDHDNWEDQIHNEKPEAQNGLMSPFMDVSEAGFMDNSSNSNTSASENEKKDMPQRKVSFPGKIMRALSLRGYKDNYNEPKSSINKKAVLPDRNVEGTLDPSSNHDGFYDGDNDFEREHTNPFDSDPENAFSTPDANLGRFDTDVETESFTFSLNRNSNNNNMQ
ncbi:ML-like domain [Nakaseomyces glabratus]|nr:Putative flavin carrier protein 3 [Nakaseomyces glabratus]